MKGIPFNVDDLNNPYISFFEPVKKKPEKQSARLRVKDRLPHEWDVLREERKIYFDHDDMIREIFNNDFEEYMRAVDEPEYMFEKLSEFQEENDMSLPIYEMMAYNLNAAGEEEELFPFMEIESEDGMIEEDIYDLFNQAMGGIPAPAAFSPFKQDNELWQNAYVWCSSALSLSENLYYKKKIKDKDIYRVYVNAYLALVKIGLGIIAEDIIKRNPSANLKVNFFQLARIYVLNSLESLRRMKNKQFCEKELINTLLDLGRKVLESLEAV